MDEKICHRCQVAKPFSEFNKHKQTKDGYCASCRSCQKVYHRQYYLRNQEKFREKGIRDRIKYADRNKEYRERNKEKASHRVREWHKNNPGRAYQYHLKKYETIEGRAYHLWNGARMRRPDGFTLTKDHVAAQIEGGFCPITGIAFQLQVSAKGAKSRSPYAPSLDKIDPTKPYTNENTRVVIWQYNQMKGELSDAEVFDLCRAVLRKAA